MSHNSYLNWATYWVALGLANILGMVFVGQPTPFRLAVLYATLVIASYYTWRTWQSRPLSS